MATHFDTPLEADHAEVKRERMTPGPDAEYPIKRKKKEENNMFTEVKGVREAW